MNLKDKTIIVTGAGSGLGAAIAIKFVEEGADVAIVGRSEDKLLTTAKKCASIGKQVLIIRADVTKEDDAKRIIQATVDKFGSIDVLVNNAGIVRFGSICNGNILEAYDVVMNTNLRAILHLTTLATPYLTITKGNVINISSIFALTATHTEIVTYSISKAALNQFTKCAAVELAPRGIRVNTVSPGPVKTDLIANSDISYDWDTLESQTALSRLGQPHEIADLVTFLASDRAKSITGSNYVSDNGMLMK